jgi:myo-inositol-1(or 4)-monophosphatase
MEARVKGVRDVVTAADFASESLIRGRLQEYFPLDGLVAEEGSAYASKSRRLWYVDPLDGTFNFSRGIPFFAVSLSLFEEGRPILGVVHDPGRSETFYAAAGQGARLKGDQLSVSDVVSLGDSVVHLTVDFDNPEMHVGLDDLQRIAPRVLKTRNLGSAALGLAYVAAGRLDAIAHRLAHTWDFGGGALLVQEAGGVITDIRGHSYTAETTNVLAASTPALHASLLDLLQ